MLQEAFKNCILCDSEGIEHFGLNIFGCSYCAENFRLKIEKIVDNLLNKIIKTGNLEKYGVLVSKEKGRICYHI